MEICKWKYDADSPVIFMIDDLCNAWVDLNGNGEIDLGEDFGAGMDGKNSSFKFLENEILKDFPKIKVTFYVPVGKRIGMIKNSKIKMHSAPINENEKVKDFFRKIHKNQRYELAYHGLTHGEVFDEAKDQKQEWECYKSLEEALLTIERGKEIFKDVTGEYPKGGKYCGYTGGKFGDESIDKSNFLWWNRFWNRGIGYLNCAENFCGKEKNKLISYDITQFGENDTIDIPSTINGGIFNLTSNNKFKQIIKYLLCFFYENKARKEINFLLKNKLVISIQEHSCFARDDGKKQTPNIFDDKKSLIKIFKYLKTKNVWYCTGTELAEYYYLRKNLKIIYKANGRFSFDCSRVKKEAIIREITLKIKGKEVVLPNNNKVLIKNRIVNLPIMQGEYKIL